MVGFEAIVQAHCRIRKSWSGFFGHRLLPQSSFLVAVEQLRFQRPAREHSIGILDIANACPRSLAQSRVSHCNVDTSLRFGKSCWTFHVGEIVHVTPSNRSSNSTPTHYQRPHCRRQRPTCLSGFWWRCWRSIRIHARDFAIAVGRTQSTRCHR